MCMAKQLVFISGVGDSRRGFYDFLVRRCATSDFTPHAYVFGWYDQTTNFEAKFKKFLAFLDQFPPNDELYLVGISAGGTAAMNALAARPNIKKVVTVCSPFVVQSPEWNPALIESIEHAQQAFKDFSPATKSKMLTIFGLRDNVVAASSSKLPDVQREQVFGLNHTSSIFFATVIMKRRLLRFLRQI